jgi:16S rRNA (guanine527-N7)-methyltransferase
VHDDALLTLPRAHPEVAASATPVRVHTVSIETDVFGPAADTASRYVDILATRGIDWGLIGPREAERLWDRHVLNSVALADLVPWGASVADVGSGAGLPGIPLAILRPDLRVTLIEPLLRRATFLTQAVDELDLADRVRVVRARAEDHRERYDVLVSRALARLPQLIRWCDPLRAEGGTVLALKGRSAEEELAEARGELERRGLAGEILTVRAHPTVEPTSVVRLQPAR